MKKIVLIFLALLSFSCKRVEKTMDITLEVTYIDNFKEHLDIDYTLSVPTRSRPYVYMYEGCIYYGFEYRHRKTAACQVRTFKVIRGEEQIDLK